MTRFLKVSALSLLMIFVTAGCGKSKPMTNKLPAIDPTLPEALYPTLIATTVPAVIPTVTPTVTPNVPVAGGPPPPLSAQCGLVGGPTSLAVGSAYTAILHVAPEAVTQQLPFQILRNGTVIRRETALGTTIAINDPAPPVGYNAYAAYVYRAGSVLQYCGYVYVTVAAPPPPTPTPVPMSALQVPAGINIAGIDRKCTNYTDHSPTAAVPRYVLRDAQYDQNGVSNGNPILSVEIPGYKRSAVGAVSIRTLNMWATRINHVWIPYNATAMAGLKAYFGASLLDKDVVVRACNDTNDDGRCSDETISNQFTVANLSTRIRGISATDNPVFHDLSVYYGRFNPATNPDQCD